MDTPQESAIGAVVDAQRDNLRPTRKKVSAATNSERGPYILHETRKRGTTPPRGRVARITVCTPTSTATRRRRCAFLSLSDRQNISPVRASERVYLEQSMLHLYAAGQQPRPIREVAAPSPLTATPPLTGGCCTLPDSTEHPVCRQERWAFRFECACCDRSRHSLLLFYC